MKGKVVPLRTTALRLVLVVEVVMLGVSMAAASLVTVGRASGTSGTRKRKEGPTVASLGTPA